MSAECRGHKANFDGSSSDFRRRLWIVIAINAAMFIVEILSGQFAHSKALQADALDFLGDSMTYALSLAVIGKSLTVRSNAAIFKAASLLLMGVWVLSSSIYEVWHQEIPRHQFMGLIGLLALGANIASVIILVPYKEGDANIRSVWLCSRNDAIGNIAVIIAAFTVWLTQSAIPDLLVAAFLATLFTLSSISIMKQVIDERKLHAAE